MMRLGCLLVLCAGLHAQDILVVTPPEFEPALEEWRAHREAQGHVIVVKKPLENLRALVQDAHKQSGGKLRFEVERDRPFPCVDVQMCRGRLKVSHSAAERAFVPQRMALRRFDEEHLRAGVGAETTGERRGGGATDLDYSEVGKNIHDLCRQ